MKHWLAAAAALSLPINAANAGIADDPKVAGKLRAAEAWLETQLAHDAVTGASVAVIHDQELVWSKGFGFANRERRVRATPTTRYSICSISKLFTSMAAMRERDAGRLELDRPISDYLGWYNIRDVETPDGPVTPRAIMSHVAGLPREAGTPYWTEVSFPDLPTIKQRLGEQSNLYRTYDRLQYSNLGMALLGEAVATTSGQDYHAYMAANFLRPLGLSNTTSELPVERWGKDFAKGYSARKMGFAREPFAAYKLNALAPAAGFASTAEDLGRFASWQFRLLDKRGEEVLRSPTLREMHRAHWVTPDRTDQAWGLGFIVWQHNGKTMVGHDGYCPGYRSSLAMRPQDKLAFVVLTNVDDADASSFTDHLYDMLAADMVAAAKTKPVEPGADSTASASKPDLAAFEGRYGGRQTANDVYVATYGDHLIAVPLYSDAPSRGTLRLRHQSGDAFRVVRDDDSLAEEVRFERDKNGRITRIWRHGNYLPRQR